MKFRKESGRTERMWGIVLVIYIGLIYGHSLMPASISSQESGFLLVKLCTQMEMLGFDNTWLTEHIIRKTAHFTEYAGLGCLLCINGRTWLRDTGRRLRTMLEMAFVIPFVDETIQLFVPGRSGQISDVWLDLCGVIVGLAAATYVAVRRHTGSAKS